MQCPTCPTLLLRLQVGSLELDECPRCLGMWFDKGELRSLLGDALEATRNLQQRYLPPTGGEQVPVRAACPRCVSGRLVAREEGDHVLAGCARCGGCWVPGTLLSYILSLEDLPEDAEDRAAQAAPGEVPAPGPPPVVASEPARAPTSAPAPTPAPAPRHAAASKALQGGCPACGRGFSTVTHAGQPFHRCQGCEGAFFSKGGLPFFLSNEPGGYRPPASLVAPEPEGARPCPGCAAVLAPMKWQNQPVRVWACEGCWSTFASAEGMRRFVHPERYMEDNTSGPALAMWRAFDRFTDWLVRPPARSHFRHLRGGRYQ